MDDLLDDLESSPFKKSEQSTADLLADLESVAQKPRRSDEEVESALPETLNFAGMDTGIPLNKSVAAGLTGMGHMLTDTYRGVRQLFGIGGEEEAKREAYNEQAMSDLYQSARGGAALGGAIAGAVAEPLGLVVPAGKAKSAASMARAGMVAGGITGGLGYVPEDRTRVGQAALGAVAGGVGGAALGAAGRALGGKPAAGADLLEGVADTYAAKVGEPAYDLLARNPGTSLSTVTGGAIGMETAGEDATFSEKAKRAAIGAALGFTGARGIAKTPLSEKLGRGFVDNYGLPEDYVRLRKTLGGNRTMFAGDFLDLAREAEKLPMDDRRLLYNMLQGEADPDYRLLEMTNKTRQKITEFGQKMVDLGILDEQTFRKNAATYLHRSYSEKLGNKPSMMRQAARKVRMIGDELKPRGVVRAMPDGQIDDFLESNPQWERFGKGRVRRQLTKKERTKLGEIDDAAFAIAETGRLMTNDIATYKFYDDVAARFGSDAEGEGLVKVAEGKIPKTAINKFGNLEGKYIPEEIYNDLKATKLYQDVRNVPGIKQYRKLNTYWKLSKTALNPVVHVNNVMSNFALYDLGDASFKHLPTAAREAWRASRGKPTRYYDMAAKMGVFDADFVTNELRGLSDDALKNYIQGLKKADTSPLEGAIKAGKAVMKPAEKMMDWYGAEDHIFRLGVFIDRLKKGASKEDAALAARRQFIDYDINAPAVNFMRETVTPFLAYTYRAIPLIAEAAAERPWKFAKWASLGLALNEAGEVYGGGDTETERRLFPGRQSGSVYGVTPVPQMLKVPLQVDDTPQYLDVTRWIPGGDVMDVTGEGQMIPYAPSPAQPSFGAAGSIYNSMVGYDPFLGKEIEGLGINKTQDLKAKGKYLAQQFVPNFPGVPGAYSTEKIMDAWLGAPNQIGDTLPVWQAVAQSVGVKLRPADVDKLKTRAGLELKRKLDALAQTAKQSFKALHKKRITPDQHEARMAHVREQMRRYMEAYQRKVNGDTETR